uniref:Uncharacterized protein n=1 Tax=Glossina brevipalpis TaxID=37001 RepID=A0A1A9WJM5_9MUSC
MVTDPRYSLPNARYNFADLASTNEAESNYEIGHYTPIHGDLTEETDALERVWISHHNRWILAAIWLHYLIQWELSELLLRLRRRIGERERRRGERLPRGGERRLRLKRLKRCGERQRSIGLLFIGDGRLGAGRIFGVSTGETLTS